VKALKEAPLANKNSAWCPMLLPQLRKKVLHIFNIPVGKHNNTLE